MYVIQDTDVHLLIMILTRDFFLILAQPTNKPQPISTETPTLQPPLGGMIIPLLNYYYLLLTL